jgi:hypothetical protein
MLTIAAEESVSIAKGAKVPVVGRAAERDVGHAEPGGQLLEIRLALGILCWLGVAISLARLDNVKVRLGRRRVAGRSERVENFLLEEVGGAEV